jgi:Flp pilus assembly protein TadD
MILKSSAYRMRWLAAAGLILPLAAQAQFPQAAPSLVQPLPPPPSMDPSDRLAANLQLLAQNPRNVIALTEAGRSAIAVGDGHAALSFLARAEELAPGDARIKADLGTALLLMEEPTEALKLYAEAASMGLPEREYARDRGLAFDLTGDARRAQRDYALALRQGKDDEVTRRLAMSLGISGDRDQGLKLLDPLLRKQDQAAWRARAFILAMNGNMKDAERIASQVMPFGMSDTMTPFLRRLAALTPAQRARAVNFGTMPDAGLRTAMIDPNQQFQAMDAGAADRLIPVEKIQVALVASETNGKARRPSKEPRRRPGRETAVLLAQKPAERAPEPIAVATANPSGRIDTRINTRIAAVDRDRLPDYVKAVLARQEGVVAKPVAGALPPPSSAPPLVKVAMAPTPLPPPPPPSAPIVKPVVAEAPPPVFEIPAAPPPKPIPVVEKPIVAPVPTPAPAPVVVAVVPPPAPLPAVVQAVPPPAPVAVAAVPPPPPSVITNVALPASSVAGAETLPPVAITTPAPVKIVAVTAPLPTDPPNAPSTTGIMGPPAPSAPPYATFPAPASDLIPAAAAPVPEVQTAQASIPEAPPAALPGLSAIIASIVPEEESQAAPLPNAGQLKAMRLAVQKKAVAEAAAKAEKEAAAKEAAEAAALAKRSPPRVWVQVATGANEAGLSGTWRKLRDGQPAIFKGQSAAYVPYKATNRVLVGPFKSQGEARAMVNAMGKAGLSGSTFASSAGQEVSRIGGK